MNVLEGENCTRRSRSSLTRNKPWKAAGCRYVAIELSSSIHFCVWRCPIWRHLRSNLRLFDYFGMNERTPATAPATAMPPSRIGVRSSTWTSGRRGEGDPCGRGPRTDVVCFFWPLSLVSARVSSTWIGRALTAAAVLSVLWWWQRCELGKPWPLSVVAGLVMTTMLVPVGIAYAEASGVPGINGLKP